MVENGNKPKGMILIILMVVLTLLILFQVIYLNSGTQIAAFGYSDPTPSGIHVRGTIYDRNGNILAIQAPEYGFYILNMESNHQELAAVIAPLTNFSSLEFASLLDEGIYFIPVKGIPSRTDIEYYTHYLESIGINDRVSFNSYEIRKYPTKHCYEILGNAEKPYKAEGGIEELFNEELKAEPTLDSTSVYGKSLVLTIDLDMQTILEDTMLLLNSKGTIILFNDNQEIVAAWGALPEEVLSNMVYSISTNTTTERHEASLSETYWNATTPFGSYHIYLDTKEKETIINSLLNAFALSGKI